ncbi:MAG TPA: molybdopterin oxidoreductase family protein [Candidatus Binataceae bacterium]|nr:molybdopterin oxidoreductase family protein [Candidatus Binataceae bacterium]
MPRTEAAKTDSPKTIVRGACPHDCPDTCAMLVTVEDGRATAVRGDPEHPFTRGALCVKVNDYVERVYSPDRVLHPLRRAGRKGSGKFERISWDAALDEIARRYRAIIAEHGAQAILPYSYLGTEGLLNGLNVGDAFFNRLGASISERTFCASGAITGYMMTVGPTPGTDPESLVHSRYIIIWACNVISTNLHLWPIIAEARRRGAKVVVIDPMRNRTAQQADWHIPIRPGTDGALALGMINVVINENLTDSDYVEKYTVGYPELKERAREYPPERVSSITGIPAADIVRLAREYARTQPAAIRFGVGIERQAGGGQCVRAISCLPALVGAWRKPGGGLVFMPNFAFPIKYDVLMRPDFIRPGTRHINQYHLGAALTGGLGLAPPLKALFVYNSNPLVVAPDQDRIVAGLEREDLFTVVSEQFITDTADFADIVLPATTQLEQLDLMFSWGHLYLTLNLPAIAPLGEAVPNTELFRRLAARMGFEDACFKRTDEETVLAITNWQAPALRGVDLDMLKRDGYARLKVGTPDTFAPHAEGNFPTASGKTEFVSSMAARGNFVLPLFRQGSMESQPGQHSVDPVPSFIAPRESAQANPALAARYPLNIISPKSHAFLNSCYANLPHQRRIAGDPAVTIHPADAAQRGIAESRVVRVFNDRGSFEALAHLSDAVRQGVVVAPLGYWRKFSKSSRSNGTVNAVNSSVLADLGNAPTFSDNLVEVEVASQPAAQAAARD